MLHVLELGHELFAVVMCQLRVHMMVRGKQFSLLAERGRHHVEHAAEQRLRHFLRQECDLYALLKNDLAAVGLHFAGDEPHDRGLARAVPADQADPFAPVYREIGIFDQKRPAEADLDAL